MHPTWNEISETRERERFLTVRVIERNFRRRRKLFVIKARKVKKMGKDSIADESSPTFLLRPNSFLSAQQDR